MEERRENNYDMLRVISAIAVIMIHVSGIWTSAITDKDVFGEKYCNGMLVTCGYNSISRFAVPCFVMLSGAFLLSNNKNIDFKYFYNKILRKVFIPTFIFSILYFLFSESLSIRKILMAKCDYTCLIEPVEKFLKGEPYYHMWYLYMMIFIYLLTPVVLILKKEIGEKKFDKISIYFLIVSSLGAFTSYNELRWDVGSSFRYLGYFMIGYVLRKNIINNKDNRKGIKLIILGLIFEFITTILRYKQALNGIADSQVKLGLLGNFAPLMVIASICIFAGFSYLNIKKSFSKLSAITLYIYIIHAGVLRIIQELIIVRSVRSISNIVFIPAIILIVLGISIILSKIYILVWDKINKRYDIADRICNLII